MKIHFLTYLMLLAGYSHSQSLELRVIGSTGDFATTASNSTLSWTLGEVVTTTENSSTAYLTQGFQQPLLINPLSIGNLDENNVSLLIFPNPTTAEITIQKENLEELNAELINVLGQVIHAYNLVDNSTQIDLSELPAANYLLRIRNQSKDEIKTFKIQKIQ